MSRIRQQRGVYFQDATDHTYDTEIKLVIIMHRVTVRERMGDHHENQILCEFVVAVCRNNIFEVDNSKSRG